MESAKALHSERRAVAPHRRVVSRGSAIGSSRLPTAPVIATTAVAPVVATSMNVCALVVMLLLSPAAVTAAPGDIATVAGTGTPGYNGDGGAATAAQINYPFGVALDGAGNLFIADENNSRVRRVDRTTGTITTVAGNGGAGSGGDGGPATAASLNLPEAVAVDGAGNVFIADKRNCRIRRVDNATGTITTVAGDGTAGFGGDGGLATAAQINFPPAVLVDGGGNLFIADGANHRVRRVDATTNVITTVAGNGTQGFGGDGGLATAAQLNFPSGLARDPAGNLFIADKSNHRIRRIDGATGNITTVAGNGTGGYGGDGGPATAAQLNLPFGLALDALGNLYIADWSNHRIRLVEAATGTITTVAGNGTAGFGGDGGPATAAQLNLPAGVALDVAGNLFIGCEFNHRIRRVLAGGGVPTWYNATERRGFPRDLPDFYQHQMYGPTADGGQNDDNWEPGGGWCQVTAWLDGFFYWRRKGYTGLLPAAVTVDNTWLDTANTGIRDLVTDYFTTHGGRINDILAARGHGAAAGAGIGRGLVFYRYYWGTKNGVTGVYYSALTGRCVGGGNAGAACTGDGGCASLNCDKLYLMSGSIFDQLVTEMLAGNNVELEFRTPGPNRALYNAALWWGGEDDGNYHVGAAAGFDVTDGTVPNTVMFADPDSNKGSYLANAGNSWPANRRDAGVNGRKYIPWNGTNDRVPVAPRGANPNADPQNFLDYYDVVTLAADGRTIAAAAVNERYQNVVIQELHVIAPVAAARALPTTTTTTTLPPPGPPPPLAPAPGVAPQPSSPDPCGPGSCEFDIAGPAEGEIGAFWLFPAAPIDGTFTPTFSLAGWSVSIVPAGGTDPQGNLRPYGGVAAQNSAQTDPLVSGVVGRLTFATTGAFEAYDFIRQNASSSANPLAYSVQVTGVLERMLPEQSHDPTRTHPTCVDGSDYGAPCTSDGDCPGGTCNDQLGCISTSTNGQRCSDALGKALAKYVGAVAKCHCKQATALFNATAFDEEGCEDVGPTGSGAKGKFQATKQKLMAAGICSAAQVSAVDTLLATLSADQSNPASLDAHNGNVFCDPSSGVLIGASDPDDAGYVPATLGSLQCACSVGKNLSKLVGAVAKCHIKWNKAYLSGGTFDLRACALANPAGKAALQKYDAAVTKLVAKGTCPACLDQGSQAALGESAVSDVNQRSRYVYPCNVP